MEQANNKTLLKQEFQSSGVWNHIVKYVVHHILNEPLTMKATCSFKTLWTT